MLEILQKIIGTVYVTYVTSAAKQLPLLKSPFLSSYTYYRGDVMYRYPAILLPLALQKMDCVMSMNKPYFLYKNTCQFEIKTPITILAFDGLKATAGCVLGKLIVDNIEQLSENTIAARVVSGVCGGIVAAIVDINPYTKTLAPNKLPILYNIIGSAIASCMVAGIWNENKTDSNSEQDLDDTDNPLYQEI